MIQGGCPVCCGDLSWFECDSDCRGNPGVESITCKTNACELSEEQRRAFWSDLVAKKQADWDALVARDKK